MGPGGIDVAVFRGLMDDVPDKCFSDISFQALDEKDDRSHFYEQIRHGTHP